MLVVGYHGCSRDVAFGAVLREKPLVPRNQPYHWLGDGIYFWENDPHRALEWAREKESRKELEQPFVIGAVIDLGRCLDLHIRENQKLLIHSHEALAAVFAAANKPMPVNKPAKKDQRADNVLRFLDCAVINHLAEETDRAGKPFDTVRGLFVEGDALYPNSNLFHKTHSEIAVRNSNAIKGYFIPDQENITKHL